MSDELTSTQLQRYARHLLLPQVDVEGQQKLLRAKVLIVGAGGLGSPAALYLAAAGVGTIGIADPDRVDRSNLQRQILYGESSVGESKVAQAGKRLRDLNADVNVIEHRERFCAANAVEFVEQYDLVLDGTDNFPARYCINDACVLRKKPNVHGSIFRFDGMLSVFAPHLQGPCYRCMHPTPPEPGAVPSCAEAGVLGVLPGVIGTLQAVEAIKLILGIGTPLIGRLLLFDALAMKFDEISIARRADCPLCGNHPTITRPIDENVSCELNMNDNPHNLDERGLPRDYQFKPDWEVTPRETKKLLDDKADFVLIDCRLPQELAITKIDGAEAIPLQQAQQHAEKLALWKDKKVIVHCRSGGRSLQFTQMLRNSGFKDVKSMAGGILLWNKDINPGGPQY